MTLRRSRTFVPGADSQADEHLEVLEEHGFYVVVYSEDPLDWVARFDKTWTESFNWANNMASTHNFRKGGSEPL